MTAQTLNNLENGSMGAKTLYPRMCAHARTFFNLLLFLLPHPHKEKRQEEKAGYPRQGMGVNGSVTPDGRGRSVKTAATAAPVVTFRTDPAAARLAPGPFTLDDLRKARAAYESGMAALDERRWQPRREYFRSLRRFPLDAHGGLSAATAPSPLSNPISSPRSSAPRSPQ